MSFHEYLILMVVAITLIAMFILPNFWKLKEGEVYCSRSGKIVKIRHKVDVGAFTLFVSNDDVRYYPDGSLVGDNFKRSPNRLVRRL